MAAHITVIALHCYDNMCIMLDLTVLINEKAFNERLLNV